ncbi:hypothetical protein GIB67_034231 [Kingdonia uniflora]|uniref:Exostosin GT47 domain-containing protein n=1 Tax=Kingdonia uniflora TaxID=39325 RepID=A0A7J7NRP6_9MAGN|nr:hypothetical protein GIB67_034231 [Kingdonia uniflora]
MVRPSSSVLNYISHSYLVSESWRSFIFIPTTLALITSCFILFYISTTSNIFLNTTTSSTIIIHHPTLFLLSNSSSPFVVGYPTVTHHDQSNLNDSFEQTSDGTLGAATEVSYSDGVEEILQSEKATTDIGSKGQYGYNEVFHDEDLFLEDYKEMNGSFKIYVYPHKSNDPYANALLPVDFEPGGNYASESYFKKVLMKSHFITKDPSEADLFFLPFSIARLRHDPRIGVGGIQDFIKTYIFNISHNYPYWNRTGGADHFYVACHSIGRSAMEKAEEVKFNAIQVVCSSSYFLSGYIAHKDASLPQIWPRQGDLPSVDISERKKLAFFAGSINSPVREKLLEVWRNDSEIAVHYGRLPTPYSDELLGSKYCLHVKGFEVNTARIGDSIYYGCVPVIIANHYDLPFADVLNWKSFSIVVATLDIPLLKEILHEVSFEEYETLQKNVLKVRKHFRWNNFTVDYDAFNMVMYELWLRRSSTRAPLSQLVGISSC